MASVIHFENPPLEEVVCGVQFTGVKWSEIHFGLLFTELEGRYDKTQRRPYLSLRDARSQQDDPPVRFVAEPVPTLLWYESEESPFLLQVQEDIFLLNWRRKSGAFKYPHFRTRTSGAEGVWDRFLREWNTFRNFCAKQEIGTPEVLMCHLAYIDHLVNGDAWDTPNDLVRLIRPLEGLKGLGSMSAFNMTIRYELGGLPVRVEINPAVRMDDKKKLFIVNFIITEKLSAGSGLDDWFDRAHGVLVQAFLNQTTNQAHDEWGLSHG